MFLLGVGPFYLGSLLSLDDTSCSWDGSGTLPTEGCVCVCVSMSAAIDCLLVLPFFGLHSAVERNVVCSIWGLRLANVHHLGFFLRKLKRERDEGETKVLQL